MVWDKKSLMKKKMKKKTNHKILIIIFAVALIVFVFFTFFSNTASYVAENLNNDPASHEATQDETKVSESVAHIETPEPMKALYMTACAASTPSFREHLLGLLDTTEFNSIIIDIKDFSGTISFPTELEGKEANGCRVPDMKEFIELLHSKDVYVIGRITVFQDPFYTKRHPELAVKKASDGSVWKDHKGLSFIEVGAKPYWEYIVDLSYESYDIGFDELNFDYVRFPSDGPMKDIAYPFTGNKDKSDALEEFFAYLYDQLNDPEILEENGYDKQIPSSADLFGMTTTNTDDLNIGQVLEQALPYFDFIAPMVYPSHYPTGFNGYGNPNSVPYEIVNFSMQRAVDRVNEMKNATSTPAEIASRLSPLQLRPWLQDFDYGGTYGVKEIHAQIDATYDAGLTSWFIWDPANRYTKGAYLRQ
jgi:hypothetical protein